MMSFIFYAALAVPAAAGYLAILTGKFAYKAAVTASCAAILLAAFAASGMHGEGLGFVLGAFAASIAGDYFLSHKESNGRFYLFGIACFFAAHALYLCYMLFAGSGSEAAAFGTMAIMAALLAAYYIYRLRRHLKSIAMRTAVLLYILISCASFSFAAASDGGLLLTIGIALILFSDICIAENDFVGNTAVGFLILPTYYLSHILITAAVLAVMAAGR